MSTEPDRTGGPMGRRIALYAGLMLVAFLVGLIPMWVVARGRAAERDVAQRDLRLCQLQNSLSSAALDARRGEYERTLAPAMRTTRRKSGNDPCRVNSETPVQLPGSRQ